MEVIMLSRTDEWGEFEELSIFIGEEKRFEVYSSSDSPEDNHLSRNFNDCYNIDTLMRLAYEAGRRGEELKIEYIEEVV